MPLPSNIHELDSRLNYLMHVSDDPMLQPNLESADGLHDMPSLAEDRPSLLCLHRK